MTQPRVTSSALGQITYPTRAGGNVDGQKSALSPTAQRRNMRCVRGIGQKVVRLLCGGKSHDGDQGGIESGALQRGYVAAPRQIFTAVLVHNGVDRSRIIRHPFVVGDLDVGDQKRSHAIFSWYDVQPQDE